MEQKTLSIESERAKKLKTISDLSHIPQSNLVEEWIDACYTVIESLNVERVSMGSLPNLKRKCVETPIIPLLVGRLAPIDNSVSNEEMDAKILEDIEKKREKK